MRLVSIGYSNHWADEQRIDAGPEDFARAMAGAQAVITNFFHGCVFAILNGKPWAAVPSDYRVIKIPDLAKMVGAEHHVIDEETSEEALEELLGSRMSPQVSARLDDYRRCSQLYLDEALS
jgi:hypothetical protein